jgi:hypothetical protein
LLRLAHPSKLHVLQPKQDQLLIAWRLGRGIKKTSEIRHVILDFAFLVLDYAHRSPQATFFVSLDRAPGRHHHAQPRRGGDVPLQQHGR